jgi:anti-sigma28 factor (negative regulator of flagellin synthesis)
MYAWGPGISQIGRVCEGGCVLAYFLAAPNSQFHNYIHDRPICRTAAVTKMGNKHTLYDDLITFKLTSKQMVRSSKKCEKNMAEQKEKLKQAIAKGNMEGARIYAQNVIREKNQALNFLRMSSRIDAVASRLETAIRMQEITKAMGSTVKGMSNAMKSMDVEKIASTMSEFEKQFEDMDVRSGKNIHSVEQMEFTIFVF